MKSKRLFWRIVDQIEAMMSGGDFPTGSRLPPERELAEIFEVSRPTVREAIIALEVRGRVEVKTGSGVYVLEPKNQQQGEASISAFELTQARALFEGEVAALAATSITEEELQQLQQTLEDMAKGSEYTEEADEKFHRIIAQATRNKAMIATIESLWRSRTSNPQIAKDFNSMCGQNSEQVLAEHTQIYDALKAKDSVAARSAMHEHFNRLINALFDAMEARALEEVRRKSNEKRGLYSLDNVVLRNA